MNYDKLLSYALRLLAKKRYTSFEIIKKCQRAAGEGGRANEVRDDSAGDTVGDVCITGDKACSTDVQASAEDVINMVIERLTELKYLDDNQYAKDYINQRIKFKPRGFFVIKRELKLKGISPEIIEKTIAEIDVSELTMALNLLEAKQDRWRSRGAPVAKSPDLRTQFHDLQAQKVKAASYLLNKGFKPDTVYKAINRCYTERRE